MDWKAGIDRAMKLVHIIPLNAKFRTIHSYG